MIKDSLKTIALSLIILSFIGVAHAWTEPTSNPPAGNVKSPLTVSSDTQYKSGLLSTEYLTSYGTTLLGADGGKVGIGTPAPGAKLHVAGGNIYSDGDLHIGTANTQKSIWLDGGYGTRITAGINRAPIQFYVNDAERVRFDTNGNVGIGTTTPSIQLALGDSDTGFKQAGDGVLTFLTNNSERMRIGSSGNVGIGTTSPTSKLSIGASGSSSYNIYSYGNTYGIAGYGSTAGAYFEDSDSRSGAYLGYGDYGLYTGNKVRVGSLCIGNECNTSLVPRATVDTSGNWRWTQVASKTMSSSSDIVYSWYSVNLDPLLPVLGIKISGSSTNGGCAAGVTNYFFGATNSGSKTTDLDIDGGWSWRYYATNTLGAEWIFDNIPAGRIGVGDENKSYYNKAAGLTYIPAGKTLYYHIAVRGGKSTTCYVDVLYGI